RLPVVASVSGGVHGGTFLRARRPRRGLSRGASRSTRLAGRAPAGKTARERIVQELTYPERAVSSSARTRPPTAHLTMKENHQWPNSQKAGNAKWPAHAWQPTVRKEPHDMRPGLQPVSVCYFKRPVTCLGQFSENASFPKIPSGHLTGGKKRFTF